MLLPPPGPGSKWLNCFRLELGRGEDKQDGQRNPLVSTSPRPPGVLGVALVSGGAPVQRGHCCLGPGDVVKRPLPWGVLELSEMSGSGLRREGKRCWSQCSRTSGTGSLDHYVSQLPVVQPWSLGALRGPDLTSLLTNLCRCLVPGTRRMPEFEHPLRRPWDKGRSACGWSQEAPVWERGDGTGWKGPHEGVTPGAQPCWGPPGDSMELGKEYRT